MNDNKELVREIETVSGFFKDLDERYGLMIRMGLLALAFIIAAVCKYMSAPVEVSMEMSRTFEDGYSGYKVFCENGQPFFGLTENGEVQRASPIEQSEYDEVMDINFAPYIGGDNMPQGGGYDGGICLQRRLLQGHRKKPQRKGKKHRLPHRVSFWENAEP